MDPSLVSRSARLAALAAPLARRMSIARSMSPPASLSAPLHSIIPAPVRSRSSFTSFAEISAIPSSFPFILDSRYCVGSGPRGGLKKRGHERFRKRRWPRGAGAAGASALLGGSLVGPGARSRRAGARTALAARAAAAAPVVVGRSAAPGLGAVHRDLGLVGGAARVGGHGGTGLEDRVR